MSTSIYKIENVKMGYKFATKKRNPFEKVKRLLFGPIDQEDNKKFVDNHLNVDYNKGCLKWNFNFREEKTLDPNGDLIWAPATPVKINRKRKPTEVADNTSNYYFQPIDVNTGSSFLFKPIEPVACLPENQTKNTLRIVKQSLITDYMVKSKRPMVCATKDTTDERPIKIPKLGEFCSS